jgi:hypothetical protein
MYRPLRYMYLSFYSADSGSTQFLAVRKNIGADKGRGRQKSKAISIGTPCGARSTEEIFQSGKNVIQLNSFAPPADIWAHC